MAAIRTTVLHKDGEKLHIQFSPGRERLSKAIYVGGRRASNCFSTSGDLRRYRREILTMVRGGWTVEITDQDDLT